MDAKKRHQEIGTSKPHFEVLDGLRGVAALGVVIFHFMEWVFTDINQNVIGHGFLAVDFFFCLSGFVIGYAYDSRMPQLGFKEFFRLRLIRLHPLVVLGSVLGFMAFLFDPFAPAQPYGVGRLVWLLACSALLIPMPVLPERAYNLFGFNAPSWSLFWEYVANIVYALVLYKVPRRALVVLTILAAIGLSWVSFRAGNLLGGWSKDSFFDGFARVSYSFMAGLLIFRSNWIIKNNFGFIPLAILVGLAFLMPGTSLNWLTELVVVVLYFPLLVALGAGSSLSPRLKAVCRFSGAISYPLYMTHYAALWVFGNYYTQKKPPMAELPYIIVPSIVLLMGFAYGIMRFYDTPIRQYLAKLWQHRGRQ